MKKVYQILKEEEISSKNNHKHKLVDATVLTPENQKVIWQYVKTRDVVAIVAIDDQNQIYCIRQWRPARKDYVWELPAGGIEVVNPTNEQVIENANRELQEEIGMKANSLKIIATFSPGVHIASTAYIVLATNLEHSQLPRDEDEDIEIKKLQFEDAYDLLINKQTPSALTLIGMLQAKLLL